MSLSFKEHPSPNFGPRKAVDGETRIRHIVVHYTGTKSCDEALKLLCAKETEVSAHYVIDEDGTIYRLVAEDQRAWHAGVSFWRGMRDINSTSIGIEIVNPGHEYGYRAFPASQMSSFAQLAADIMARHRLPAACLLGHSDVAPSRKQDPGELFPWQRLAAQGLGLWPAETTVLAGHPDLNGALRRLSEIGYAVPLTPELGSDILTPESGATDVLSAFQSRYRPSAVTGKLDNETATLIAAVDVAHAKSRSTS
jgi:N-acetylmuramoyl-L-alanine amidase